MDPVFASAVGDPTGRYSAAPPGHLTTCPGCGMVVDHFLQKPVVYDPPAEWRPARVEKPPVVASVDAEPGDLYSEQTTAPVEPEPRPIRAAACGVVAGSDVEWNALAHPSIGGKIPIVLALLGRDAGVQASMVASVLASVPKRYQDLHVLYTGNRDQLPAILGSAESATVYSDSDRPVGLFADALRKIGSQSSAQYLVYLSDSAFVRNPAWLKNLAETIIKQPREAHVGLFGVKRRTVLTGADAEKAADWFRIAEWHRGLPFRNRSGKGVPNGNEIHYVMGQFWAAKVRALIDCGVPDRRLTDAGFAVCLGEQLYQGGWNTKIFDGDHRQISVSTVSRHPQTPPWFGGK